MNCIKRMAVLLIIILLIVLLPSCIYKLDAEYEPKQETANSPDTIPDCDTQIISVSSPDITSESNENEENTITFNILDKKTIAIDKDRLNDGDRLGTDHIDNRWELREIDDILNALKGAWQTDEYVGFVFFRIYCPDLFDDDDYLEPGVRERLFEEYDEKVEYAKNNIPDICFSIKEYMTWSASEGYYFKDINSNYIYTNGNVESPVSVILSLDRLNDVFLSYADQTAISSDFFAEYPVLYIKFFIYRERNQYSPATLVITSDNRFYLLIDGAFYSLKEYSFKPR